MGEQGRPKSSQRARGAPVRVTRDQWIDEGLRVLAESNVDKVRVEVLAKRLGVTKGGFYGHFADREDLLGAMLKTWRAVHTARVADWLRRTSANPGESLRRLAELARADRFDVPGGALERAIRAWAAEDPAVAAVIAGVDAERMTFLAELYEARGLAANDARTFALLNYAYRIGVNTIAATSPAAALADHPAQCERWLEEPERVFAAAQGGGPSNGER